MTGGGSPWERWLARLGKPGDVAPRLARGSVWTMLSVASTQAITVVASVAVARFVGAAGLGQFALVQSTVGAVGLSVGVALTSTSTRYVAARRQTDPAAAGAAAATTLRLAVGAGIALAGMIWAGADFLARHTMGDATLESALRVGALQVVFLSLNGAQAGVLAGMEEFAAGARLSVIRALSSLPLLLVGLALAGINGALAGLAAGLAIQCWVSQRALVRYAKLHGIRINARGGAVDYGLIWRFTVPALLSGAIVGPVFWCGNVMLARQPEGYLALGLYNATVPWRALVALVPSVVSQAALPILTQLTEAGSAREYRGALGQSLALSVFSALAVAAPLALGHRLLLAAYGPAFQAATALLLIGLLTGVLIAVNTTVGVVIASGNRMWHGFLLNATWAVALLGLAALLIPSQGAMGLAWATCGAYLFHTMQQAAYARWAGLTRASGPWE